VLSEAAPLPRSSAMLYASGAAGAQVMLQTLTVWLVYFYVSSDDGRLAPLVLVGIATTIGRFSDAITDPLIGYWSDVTRSRWGRRAPFIVLGAPFMAAAFILVWTPPMAGEHWLNGIWLAVVLQFYFLMVTIVAAPFTGIYPELAVSDEDRVLVSAWQLVFGLIGAGFALIATPLLIDWIGFAGTGVVVAILGTLPRYLGLWGARGRLHYQPEAPASFREFRANAMFAFRVTITNRNFLYLLGSLLCFQAGVLMLTQGVPFFVVEVLGLARAMQSVVLASFFVASLVMVPVVVWSTRRYAKRTVYAICLLGASALLPLLGLIGLLDFMPPLMQAVVLIGLIGLPASGILILPDAMLADVVDEDALSTQSRREAMYFSSRATLEKTGQALASGLFIVLLGVFGATAENPLGIRLIGPAAAICTLLGLWLLLRGYRSPARETERLLKAAPPVV
jgi:glycoside/pentoside/hexuronide:cation symporter, GPH family